MLWELPAYANPPEPNNSNLNVYAIASKTGGREQREVLIDGGVSMSLISGPAPGTIQPPSP